jgi:hypothetical protein
MIKSSMMRWQGMYREWGRRGRHIGYCWESQKVRDHWEDQDVGEWTILKWILERERMGWIGLIWLRIGASGGLL